MDTHERITKRPSGSSFDITLEETLKALYERRLKIIKTLRALETEKRERSEPKLKGNKVAF